MLKMVRLGQGNSSPFIAVPPDAPTIGTATRGDQQATVTFTPPAYDGGAQITSYIVTASPGGLSGQAVGSPITVYGLTNGVSYTFTVKAGNSAGFGASSPASNAVTPAGVPFAPAIGTATRGNGMATVSFTPGGNNGEPIFNYTVTSNPGNITATGASSPVNVTGLTNGVSYTFTVKANNVIGSSVPSAASNAVTPATVPGAPTIGAASLLGVNAATVAFTAPASNGGAAITGYTATSSPGGLVGTNTASPITVNGLSQGVAYTFTVTASNAIGTSAASAASNSITTPTAPGAPTGLVATPGIAQASVSWIAPASNGGSAITGYQVTIWWNGGANSLTQTTTGLSYTFYSLGNGNSYYFTVKAVNAVGAGASSAASATVTTHNVPAAPTIVNATTGVRSATVSFTPNANNGSAITSFTVTASPGGAVGTGSASPITVNGLADATTYTFTVTATNAVGTSAPSAASNSIQTYAVPGAPTGVVADLPTTNSMRVSWSPPTSDGGAPITNYLIKSTNGHVSTWVSSTVNSTTVSGLSGGTSYTFTVQASNAVGIGPESAPSNTISTIAPTPPDAPTGVYAVPQNGGAPGSLRSISVYFTPPANSGGGPITGYTAATWDGATSISGTSSPITFPNNAQGFDYSFKVKATNAYGDSAWSAQSTLVRLVNYPGAPVTLTGFTVQDSQIILAWSDDANTGGSTSGITQFYVYMSTNGGAYQYHSTVARVPGGTSTTVAGLTNGNNYAFRIASFNGVYNGYDIGQYLQTPTGTPVYVPPLLNVVCAPDALGAVATFPNAPSANTSADTMGTGTGPFTYQWYWASGGGGLSLTNDTSQTVTVVATNAAPGPIYYSGTLEVLVTDLGIPVGEKGRTDTAQCYVEFTQY